MTDNDIIKALECCNSHGIDACIECPYCDKYPNCIADRNDDCIGLINRQKAEIERLKSMNQSKLDIIHDVRTDLETAKSEAIKEFAERLKAEIKSDLYGDDVMPRGTIDWLVKEMAEQ